MAPRFVLGLDLAGPANAPDTAAALFATRGTGLALVELRTGLDDRALLAWLRGHVPVAGALVAGLDAPLSYNPGGGDRPGDRALRARLTAAGLPPGSVMAPTMTRMAYLTLRGMAVARLLQATWPDPFVCETHPGGSLVLRGAEAGLVRSLKRVAGARTAVLAWLATQGVRLGSH